MGLAALNGLYHKSCYKLFILLTGIIPGILILSVINKGVKMSQVAFTGSRAGFPVPSLVKAVVLSVAKAGHSLLVGCANGVDAMVRHHAPNAQVFNVAAPGCGSGRSFAAALAQRSQIMVNACSVLVGFCSVACPSSLSPASHFSGQGSGTWSSVAYAVALGHQVFIFPAAGVSLPSWSGGQWVKAAPSGLWSLAYTWQNHSSQLRLF